MSIPITKECPVCAQPVLELFFEQLNVPIYCNLLWSDKPAARHCPRGEIKLAYCPQCGFITNISFDPNKMSYSQTYENSLCFSAFFQDYANQLAKQLIEQYQLFNKNIIEIGSGKGDFLILLCESGNNRGIGFDPSYVPQEAHRKYKDQITFIQDLYSERYLSYQADFICSRHILEHIPRPGDLLNLVRRSTGGNENIPVFIEVPNASHIFDNLAIWDIIYEHCSYFTPVSLSNTFLHCGFQVDEIYAAYDDQFLCIHATAMMDENPNSEDAVKMISDFDMNSLTQFASNYKKKIQNWRQKLSDIVNEKHRIVLWGAGSKGVTFLNVLEIHDSIEYVVDINPRKHGKYIAGTGQQIVPPDFLKNYKPDAVIIMNPIYKEEIQHTLNLLGLKPEFIYV